MVRRITNEIHIKRYPAKTLRLVVYNKKCEIEKVVSPGRSKVYFDKPQNIERAFFTKSRRDASAGGNVLKYMTD